MQEPPAIRWLSIVSIFLRLGGYLVQDERPVTGKATWYNLALLRGDFQPMSASALLPPRVPPPIAH